MTSTKKNLLVTGGAGFIGSNFINYIHKKYPHYNIQLLDALTYAGNLDNIVGGLKSNGNFRFLHGNVTHPDIVNQLVADSDYVIHFAAESHVTRSIYDNSLFFETDVIGTQVLANAMVKHPVERFIHISSSEVYGTALTDPMTEEHPLNPMSPYAAAKAGADRLVYSYIHTYNMPAVIVRPFNNYGPFQHLEKAIPNFIVSALNDQPVTVHGGGQSLRDWMYVEDTCEGLDRIMHADADKVVGEAINLGTGIDTDILTVAKKVLDILGKPQSLIEHIEDRPGQVSRHISSTDKARDLLGWEAKIKLDDGLQRTVEFYRDNRQWWEKFLWMKELWGPR
ncbi:MAG: GDP-mannose 4,6-dehydratase [Nitrospinae bacterium]|nr:GDP-mannose 4,6-dehydratase [Nitrospinota bacterium]